MCTNHDPVGTAIENIYRYGLSITAVFDDDRDLSRNFAYSSGLTALGRPELILHGLPLDIAGAMINTLADRMRAGTTVTAGDRVSHLLCGFDIALVDVIDTRDMLVTRELYPGFTALQMVWPDQRGRFPWEDEYSMCQEHQPLRGPGWV